MLQNMTDAQLYTLINKLLSDPDSVEESLRQYARDSLFRRRERIIRNNARYAQLLTQITDKQALKVSQHESNGYTVNQVFYDKRNVTGNVAVMMVKPQVYDDISGKVKEKLVVVYSNGEVEGTFAKKINIRKVL